MDGLSEVFTYPAEECAPPVGHPKIVRPRNWSGQVKLALDSTFTGVSSHEKEEKVVEQIKESLVAVLTSQLNILFAVVAADFTVPFVDGGHPIYISSLDLRIYLQLKNQTTQAKLISCTKHVPASITWRPIVGGLTSDPQFTSDLHPQPPIKFFVIHGEHQANYATKRKVNYFSE